MHPPDGVFHRGEEEGAGGKIWDAREEVVFAGGGPDCGVWVSAAEVRDPFDEPGGGGWIWGEGGEENGYGSLGQEVAVPI